MKNEKVDLYPVIRGLMQVELLFFLKASTPIYFLTGDNSPDDILQIFSRWTCILTRFPL
jgi:hypothetical protein